MAGGEQTWLVKSGDKILGPFSDEEVIRKLKAKEIVVIDEISAPESRWRYIRDEPKFATIVEEIRRHLLTSREDTEVQGHTSVDWNPTVTDSMMSPETNATAPIDPNEIQDAEFTEETLRPAATQGRSSAARQYGVGHAAGRESAAGFSKVLWVIAGIVIFAALWLIMRDQEPSRPSENNSFDKLVDSGHQAWLVGEFDEALVLYRRAEQAEPGNPSVVSRLAPLLIQIDGQTVEAKRLLTETLGRAPASLDPYVKTQLQTGLGLAALSSDDLADAEANFKTAIAGTPRSHSAHFNSGMTAYLQRDYDEAYRRFTSAGDEPAALLMAARSIIDSKGADFKKAEGALRRLITRHYDYRQEALVLSAYADLQTGDKRGAVGSVRLALDTDPDATEEHWHDPMLYLEPMQWRRMTALCRTIGEQIKANAAKALYAMCLAKSGEHEKASAVLQAATGASSEDPYLRAMGAYLLMKADRNEEARAALKLAGKSEPVKLARLVEARLCTRAGDRECASQAWQALVSGSDPPPSAYTGLAEVKINDGDTKGAGDLVNKALVLSSRYKPALVLRDRITKQ